MNYPGAEPQSITCKTYQINLAKPNKSIKTNCFYLSDYYIDFNLLEINHRNCESILFLWRKTMPGIREAIEQRDWKLAQQQIQVAAEKLNQLATYFKHLKN